MEKRRVQWAWWPLSKVVPYERNARVHSVDQVKQIAASIREFGWQHPILVDKEGVIIAGHGRLEAANELGLCEAPVVVAKNLSPEKVKALRLADNKIAENSSWDKELLALEIEALDLEGINLDVIGFSDAELAQLLADEDDEAGDAEAEWKGMPEFKQGDKKAFRSLVIHFKDQSAVDDFAKLIGQKITDKTRFAWFPEIEIETYADKEYVSGGKGVAEAAE